MNPLVAATRPRSRVIQVFARAPVAGRAKTRLIPALGAQGAARLHARMVEHTLQEAAAAALALAAELQVWVADDHDPAGWLAAEAGRRGARLRAQPAGDLGARMCIALDGALDAGSRVILVGSDCPARRATDFADAFAALDAGHDGVLQPALDGGYTLIGLSRHAPALFRGIDWGTGQVHAQTCARARAQGLRLADLPPTWDVDRPEDLERLATLGPSWRAVADDAARGP